MRLFHPYGISQYTAESTLTSLNCPFPCIYLLPPSLCGPSAHTQHRAWIPRNKIVEPTKAGKAELQKFPSRGWILTMVKGWKRRKGKARGSGVFLHATEAAQLTSCTALFVLADLGARIWLWAGFCQGWSVFDSHHVQVSSYAFVSHVPLSASPQNNGFLGISMLSIRENNNVSSMTVC